jgi:hypothetical protein
MHLPADNPALISVADLASALFPPNESCDSGLLDSLNPWCSVHFVQFEHIGCCDFFDIKRNEAGPPPLSIATRQDYVNLVTS